MGKGLEIQLDQLEAFIQLIQLDKPELKKATYKELGEAISTEFGVEVNEQDLFLLYEPTLDEEIRDKEAHFGSMFNFWNELY